MLKALWRKKLPIFSIFLAKHHSFLSSLAFLTILPLLSNVLDFTSPDDTPVLSSGGHASNTPFPQCLFSHLLSRASLTFTAKGSVKI